jgi:hypothetical protein
MANGEGPSSRKGTTFLTDDDYYLKQQKAEIKEHERNVEEIEKGGLFGSDNMAKLTAALSAYNMITGLRDQHVNRMINKKGGVTKRVEYIEEDEYQKLKEKNIADGDTDYEAYKLDKEGRRFKGTWEWKEPGKILDKDAYESILDNPLTDRVQQFFGADTIKDKVAADPDPTQTKTQTLTPGSNLTVTNQGQGFNYQDSMIDLKKEDDVGNIVSGILGTDDEPLSKGTSDPDEEPEVLDDLILDDSPEAIAALNPSETRYHDDGTRRDSTYHDVDGRKTRYEKYHDDGESIKVISTYPDPDDIYTKIRAEYQKDGTIMNVVKKIKGNTVYDLEFEIDGTQSKSSKFYDSDGVLIKAKSAEEEKAIFDEHHGEGSYDAALKYGEGGPQSAHDVWMQNNPNANLVNADDEANLASADDGEAPSIIDIVNRIQAGELAKDVQLERNKNRFISGTPGDLRVGRGMLNLQNNTDLQNKLAYDSSEAKFNLPQPKDVTDLRRSERFEVGDYIRNKMTTQDDNWLRKNNISLDDVTLSDIGQLPSNRIKIDEIPVSEIDWDNMSNSQTAGLMKTLNLYDKGAQNEISKLQNGPNPEENVKKYIQDKVVEYQRELFHSSPKTYPQFKYTDVTKKANVQSKSNNVQNQTNISTPKAKYSDKYKTYSGAGNTKDAMKNVDTHYPDRGTIKGGENAQTKGKVFRFTYEDYKKMKISDGEKKVKESGSSYAEKQLNKFKKGEPTHGYISEKSWNANGGYNREHWEANQIKKIESFTNGKGLGLTEYGFSRAWHFKFTNTPPDNTFTEADLAEAKEYGWDGEKWNYPDE